MNVFFLEGLFSEGFAFMRPLGGLFRGLLESLLAGSPFSLQWMGPPGSSDGNFIRIIFDAGPIVQLVLIVLVGMSTISWALIFQKLWGLYRAERTSNKFLDIFWERKNLHSVYEAVEGLGGSPLAEVYRSGYQELAKSTQNGNQTTTGAEAGTTRTIKAEPAGIENVTRAMQRARLTEITRLERSLTFLASTGSTAPFIGLFGTVWGIMSAFRKIGVSGSASLAVVAPGISEALIATAVGLFAAIPAVVAYNHLIHRIKVLDSHMESFTADFLNIADRHFFRK